MIAPELHGVVLRWAGLTSADRLAEVQIAIPTGHSAEPLVTWMSQAAARAAG